jgi:hypothetical protein
MENVTNEKMMNAMARNTNRNANTQVRLRFAFETTTVVSFASAFDSVSSISNLV